MWPARTSRRCIVGAWSGAASAQSAAASVRTCDRRSAAAGQPRDLVAASCVEASASTRRSSSCSPASARPYLRQHAAAHRSDADQERLVLRERGDVAGPGDGPQGRGGAARVAVRLPGHPRVPLVDVRHGARARRRDPADGARRARVPGDDRAPAAALPPEPALGAHRRRRRRRRAARGVPARRRRADHDVRDRREGVRGLAQVPGHVHRDVVRRRAADARAPGRRRVCQGQGRRVRRRHRRLVRSGGPGGDALHLDILPRAARRDAPRRDHVQPGRVRLAPPRPDRRGDAQPHTHTSRAIPRLTPDLPIRR